MRPLKCNTNGMNGVPHNNKKCSLADCWAKTAKKNIMRAL